MYSGIWCRSPLDKETLGITTSWMGPLSYSAACWDTSSLCFVGSNKNCTMQSEAVRKDLEPISAVARGAVADPVFRTFRRNFYPSILHCTMALGKLVLLWVNAQLPLPKGRQSKLQKRFRVPGIHFTLGRAASAEGEECQRLFGCRGLIVVIMGVVDSCVDQAVTNMTVVLRALYRSSLHCDSLPDQLARAAKAISKAVAPTSKGHIFICW